ncbi:hypothetical protein GTY65_01010 [Streptomyces sp. SID8379]|uniref:hypothetical protein n=1 Tax=unclassified Streptomyces TaxID=2593676 RepID=UPI0003611CC2|nr:MULTISPECIES: hypothetical protein [unclassified Streptomyces]MYW62665.1 hypothetical protein [Streptomyces sp. SID8379]
MTSPYTPVPRWARKRIVIPVVGVAFLLGGALGTAGDGGQDNGSTKVAASRPQPTATVTATATATESARPEPAPTVTATKTVKVKVTVTTKAAAGSGTGGSTTTGGGGGSGQAASGTCSIVSNSGNCYAAGQFCRNSDHGASTTNAGGTAITCRYSSNAWRWSYS